jgi:hypothetical protein
MGAGYRRPKVCYTPSMMKQHNQHITDAERYVTESEQRVTRQTALVEQLARSGHNTMEAHRLLAILKASLGLARADLQQLLDGRS